MKPTKTLCLASLIGVAFSANAQNVWTGTTVPTTTSGSLGVGTTTPLAKLQVHNNNVSPTGPPSLMVSSANYFTNVANTLEAWNYTKPASTWIGSLDMWLSSGGIFGVKSLSNTTSSNKMVVADASGNLKTSSFSIYSNPAGGNGDLNSLTSVSNIRFIDAAAGWGGGNLTGGLGGLYIDVPLNISSNEFVSGYINCSYLVQTSDKRLKENIRSLGNNHAKLFNINSYSYTLINDKKADPKLHFGFIAQDVEKEFPDLVNVDEKGAYALNYIEFIPLLLEELKAQKAEIDDLKEQLTAMEAKLNGASGSRNGFSDKGLAVASSTYMLAQNTPNPFNQETVIKFNAGNAANAFIGIYDLNGKQLQRIIIKAGEQQIKLSANTLQPGTYVYNLVADGQLIDSKKMVVID